MGKESKIIITYTDIIVCLFQIMTKIK